MTEVLTLDPAPPAAPECTNCGAPLHGPFCAACGQESKPLDPPVRYFVREFAQELFDVDSRVVRSLRRLVFSPGLLTREHVEGRRAPWVSPLKLYLLTSVAAFAVQAVAGDHGAMNMSFTPGPGEPMTPEIERLNTTLAAVRTDLIPRVMFVLVPLFAWLVGRVRRDSARHYPAHLVFALHVFAATFAVRAAVTAVTLPLPGPAAGPWRNSIVAIYGTSYMVLALRAAYGGSWLRAFRDLVVVGIAHWLATMIVAGGTVMAVALLRVWLAQGG
jgi:hypothetical protein